MRLQFFSGKFVARLRESAAANFDKYGADTSWLETFAAGQTHIHESNLIVDPPPALVTSADNNSEHDAENAKRVFSWLRNLTPALAMEERLWAHLTHCAFPEYMSVRWPVESESAVHRRYLFEGKSFAALSRNGVARLWWAGHLTIDEKRTNPFELTDVLFLRQDIQVALLERSIGKCRNIRTSVLEFLRDNSYWMSEESFGRRIQVLARELNLLGGVAVLDALPASEVQGFLSRIGENFVSELGSNGRHAPA
jgi:hypothetical protein